MTNSFTAKKLLEAHALGRACVYRACEGLSQKHSAWKPAEHVKSIQEMVVHLGGSERYWLGLMGYSTTEFQQSDQLDDALKFVKEMEQTLGQIAASQSADELNKVVATERGDLSLGWMIKRVTQHMFYHLGTIVYLRSICEPEWEGDAGMGYWQQAADAFSAMVTVAD